MKHKLILVLLFSFIASPAYASTAVKMVGLKPTTSIQLSQNPNDEVSSLIVSPNSIAVVGTTDGDGFITAYDRTATSILWSIKLGGALEDIATSATRDSNGVIWVVGASAVAADAPASQTIPAGTLNPSGVLPDTSTALPQLKQLNIWKISSKGSLLSTYQTVLSDVIYPTSITVKAGKATVVGSIASHPLDEFVTSLGVDGNFGAVRIISSKTSIAQEKSVKTTLSVWKSFTTSTAIKGLPNWKPKANSHVLIRYDAKSKAVVAAYITSGDILDLAWEKSLGIVALINYPTGYSLAIVK